MKSLILSSAAAAMIAGIAQADIAPATSPFLTTVDPMKIEASQFIGMRVYASEAQLDADEYAGLQTGWDDIGEINDVVLSRDGKIDAVLVDIGGFLGIGERQVAVDMAAIKFVSDGSTAEDLDDFFLVLNADRPTLEGAPAYGVTEDQAAMPVTPVETEATQMATVQTPADPSLNFDVSALRAEDIQGSPVYDANDEWIGEVSQLIVSPEGRVLNAVIDVGGFLGIGEKACRS